MDNHVVANAHEHPNMFADRPWSEIHPTVKGNLNNGSWTLAFNNAHRFINGFGKHNDFVKDLRLFSNDLYYGEGMFSNSALETVTIASVSINSKQQEIREDYVANGITWSDKVPNPRNIPGCITVIRQGADKALSIYPAP